MLNRSLGKSGLQVSALGLGCWAIGGPWTWAQPGQAPFPAGWGEINDDESMRAIHAGLDAGVIFFDTAANYGAGHSERVLGRALKGRRVEADIATKFGHIIDEQAGTVYGDDDRILDNLRSGGRSMAQGALAYIWALDARMIPIPGFKTVQQVKENAAAMEFGPLSRVDLRQVQEIVGAHQDDSE